MSAQRTICNEYPEELAIQSFQREGELFGCHWVSFPAVFDGMHRPASSGAGPHVLRDQDSTGIDRQVLSLPLVGAEGTDERIGAGQEGRRREGKRSFGEGPLVYRSPSA